MNIFKRLLDKLPGRKKPSPVPDFSERMARFDREHSSRVGQRVSKSHGAPSQRMVDSSRQQDDIMSSLANPLNPLNPIGLNSSIYQDSTPSHSSHSSSGYDCGSSSSSGYDSGSSSSCDSGSSSSSSD